MTFGQAISHNIRSMFRFSGRDPRSAFWWYVLFYFLGSIAANTVDGMLLVFRAEALLDMLETPEAMFDVIFGDPWFYVSFFPVSLIWMLVNLVPLFSCGIRRRHDCDKSGVMFAVIYLAGLVASVLGIAMMFQFMGIFQDFVLTSAELGGPGLSPFDDDETFAEVIRYTGILSVLSLLQFVAGIVVLIMMCTKGTDGPNRYGEDPLMASATDISNQSI